MKYTYLDIKNSYPKEKEKLESLYGRIIPVRKISFLLTRIIINTNILPWHISVVSIGIAILGCILIGINNKILQIIGVLLVAFWHIFDCIDGNIARVKKISSMLGSFVDACSGYFIMAFLPISIGIGAFYEKNNIIFILLGGIASISGILMRLIHQKYAYTLSVLEKLENKKYEKGDNAYQLTGFHKIRKKLDIECNSCGLPMLFLLISPFFNIFYILAIYYFIFYLLSLLIGTIYYLKKGKE